MKILIIIGIVIAVAFNCSACEFSGYPSSLIRNTRISEDLGPGSGIKYFHASGGIENVTIASPYINVVKSRYEDMYEFKTTQLFGEYADKYRRKTMATYVTLKCTDGSFKFYYWTIDIYLVITKPPVFRESSYNYQIKLPWSLDKPINFDHPIIVSDKDYYQNVDITPSIEPVGLLSIIKTKLFDEKTEYVDADEALFKLDLKLASGLAPGQYTFSLTVNDGKFSANTQVTLNVTY